MFNTILSNTQPTTILGNLTVKSAGIKHNVIDCGWISVDLYLHILYILVMVN